MTTDSRTVAFLYLLMYEHLPVVVIEDAIRSLDALEGEDEGYDLDNDTLAEMANELAGRIRP